MSISKVTPIGRASFPNLSRPDQFNKYSLSILFPKSDPKVTEFVKWLHEAVVKEAMGVAGEAGVNDALANFTNFKDGDVAESFKTHRPEYEGHYILNVSRKTEFGKPCLVNRDKQPIDADEIYAGCNVLAYIDVFGYKYGTKKGVSMGFQHVMKTGENTPFASSGIRVDDAFSSLDIPVDSEEGEEIPTPEAPKSNAPKANGFKFGATATSKPKSKAPVNPFSGV